MRFLYLDDSGSAGNKEEEYFVLGGICVPEQSVRWLTHQIDSFAFTIDQAAPQNVEFHAAEIFRGKISPWDGYKNKKDRIGIIKNVLCLLEKTYPDLVIFACAVHKASFPKQDPVLLAYEEISSRFNIYLERDFPEPNQERGMIIIDKTSYESGLQNLTNTIRREGNRWGYQMRRIIEVPLFIDSKSSRVTQLADHIVYAIFRRYNAEDVSYFNCIEDRLYQKDGIIHGLVHRQTINLNCTCPACITRPHKPSYVP